MNLRNVLYPLYGIKVLFLFLFMNYLIWVKNLKHTHTHTQCYSQYLRFESYKSCFTKPACMADEEWEFAQPHTFTRLVGLIAPLFSVSRDRDRMWSGYSWPSTGMLFRKQMWYMFFCLKLNDFHYILEWPYSNLLFHLCFLIYNNSVGY